MKIQCSCGAKFEFEITGEMSTAPVSFTCPACGRDSSEFVDSLVRRELGQASTPVGTPVRLGGVPAVAPPPSSPGLTLRAAPKPQPESETSQAGESPVLCLKHPGQIAANKCQVCGKPICPKCMELFGYVCSPLCKAKAESHGVHIPTFAGQKSAKEARLWRKAVWAASSLGAVAALLLGFWLWYAWFGSVPKSIFSVRFPEMAYAGQSAFGGPNQDQIVLLHGATLARYSLSPKKKLWSVELLDHEKFARLADEQRKAIARQNSRLADQGVEDLPRIPAADKLIEQLETDAEEQMKLVVHGESIWVESPGKLVRYDWGSGRITKTLQVPQNAMISGTSGDELTVMDTRQADPRLIRVNLNTCDMQTEDFASQPAGTNLPTASASDAAEGGALAGLPLGTPGRDRGKPMDPGRVAEQAQHLSLPQRLALPATLANSMNQERELAAMDDRPKPAPGPPTLTPETGTSLVATRNGFLRLSVKVLESRIIQRSAIKPDSGKHGLDEGLTAGSSMDAANGILNQMQRERGGDLVQEDLSRNQVTVSRPGKPGSWTGEVTGPPRVFPLESVTVLAAGKTFYVLNRQNKQLWKASLSFNLPDIAETGGEGSSRFGEGPCVERNGSLYIFDQGYLACFDLASGNRRWGLPSVGIAGLLFDSHNMIYVNTSSASPDKIRYSREIDLSQKVTSVILKVDGRNGKVLWQAQQLGLVSYVSGKVVLTVESYQPPEEDGPSTDTGFETPPYLRIRRLNANNGHEIWQHFQQRAPVDIGFERNTIRLVFRKEVEVLKFLVL